MFRSHGFESQLTKYNFMKPVESEPNNVSLTIEYVSDDEKQIFLESLETVLNVKNVYKAFRDPIRWNSISFKDDILHDVNIVFDEVTFKAKLVSIAVTRKFKSNGDIAYIYKMTFEKEVGDGNEDTLIPLAYLGAIEMDEDGKKIHIKYNTKLTDGNV